jgi:hypothetical protein
MLDEEHNSKPENMNSENIYISGVVLIVKPSLEVLSTSS